MHEIEGGVGGGLQLLEGLPFGEVISCSIAQCRFGAVSGVGSDMPDGGGSSVFVAVFYGTQGGY